MYFFTMIESGKPLNMCDWKSKNSSNATQRWISYCRNMLCVSYVFLKWRGCVDLLLSPNLNSEDRYLKAATTSPV